MVTKVITNNDIDLNTLIIEGNKLKVNVANVVPAAKADRFLKSVTPNVGNKTLTFVTGAENEQDTSFEVAIGDFLTGVATQEALDAEKAKVQALETAKAEAEAKVAELEGKVTALESKPEFQLTADAVAALVAEDVLKNAILNAIKGEEIQALDGAIKGYLLTA